MPCIPHARSSMTFTTTALFIIAVGLMLICNVTARADSLDYSYDAVDGMLPHQQDWHNEGYVGVDAKLVNDAITGERTLRIDNTEAGGSAPFANWRRTSSGGSGSADDFMTLDVRFRLLNHTPSDQFSISLARPANDTLAAAGFNEQSYLFRFNTSGVTFHDGSGFVNYAAGLDQQWHDARITVDNANGTARLYLNGSSSPLFSQQAVGGNLGRNEIRFGDGSSTVVGAAQISQLSWTNKAMRVPINGGEVSFLGRQLVAENADEHVNFPFATRFGNGAIALSHSVGTHTTPAERGELVWSPDNGQTWTTTTPIPILAAWNSHQFDDGSVIALAAWNTSQARMAHDDVLLRRWTSPDAGFTTERIGIELPWASTLAIHRSMVRAADGSLVQTAYGRGVDDDYDRSFTLRSIDNGASWSYGGTIGFDPTGPSFNEPTIVNLSDGTLLALIRTQVGGTIGPLVQSKSSDFGVTWSDPVKIADYGVDPHVIRLTNGALVASGGRPGIFLLVDLTGTGDHWQQIPFYDGLGSSYTTLLEVEPNRVMVLYDESGFYQFPDLPDGVPNRVYATYIDIVPEPGAAGTLLALSLAWFMRRRDTQ